VQNFSHSQFDLSRYIQNKQKIINEALVSIIDKSFNASRLCQAMKYSLMAPGKRLRPILCLAAAETVNKIETTVISSACAIEMIHTYSLIHDDLPSMDNDRLRRGQLTCHIQFDEATAILAGDALLTIAFEILSSMAHEPKVLLKIIHELSHSGGYMGMIEGQMEDISAEGARIDLEALRRMHRLKTGALIEASVKIGALISGATSDQIQQLSTYAQNIGLAFQVTHDILNVEGDAKTMGKATGTDKSQSKSTFPSVIGMDQAKKYAQELVNNALQALSIFGNKATPLSALAVYIIERKR